MTICEDLNIFFLTQTTPHNIFEKWGNDCLQGLRQYYKGHTVSFIKIKDIPLYMHASTPATEESSLGVSKFFLILGVVLKAFGYLFKETRHAHRNLKETFAPYANHIEGITRISTSGWKGIHIDLTSVSEDKRERLLLEKLIELPPKIWFAQAELSISGLSNSTTIDLLKPYQVEGFEKNICLYDLFCLHRFDLSTALANKKYTAPSFGRCFDFNSPHGQCYHLGIVYLHNPEVSNFLQSQKK